MQSTSGYSSDIEERSGRRCRRLPILSFQPHMQTAHSGVGVGVGVSSGVGVSVGVTSGVGVSVAVGCGAIVGVCVGVSVAVGCRAIVGVGVVTDTDSQVPKW